MTVKLTGGFEVDGNDVKHLLRRRIKNIEYTAFGTLSKRGVSV